MKRMEGYMGKYPTMVYNPSDPDDYKICKSAEEIPEGWVDHPAKCIGGRDYADEEGLYAVDGEREQPHERQHENGSIAGQDGHGEPRSSGQNADEENGHAKQPRLQKNGNARKVKRAPAKKTAPKVTLASLKIKRQEAEEVLEEEGVEFSEEDSDNEIAAKIAPLLD